MLGFAALSPTYDAYPLPALASGTGSSSPLSFWYNQPPVLKSDTENHQSADAHGGG